MSYEKAMRHWANPRKLRTMRRGTYMGFDTGSPKETPEVREAFTCIRNIRDWFSDRHTSGDAQHSRECIRAEIISYRKIFDKNGAKS